MIPGHVIQLNAFPVYAVGVICFFRVCLQNGSDRTWLYCVRFCDCPFCHVFAYSHASPILSKFAYEPPFCLAKIEGFEPTNLSLEPSGLPLAYTLIESVIRIALMHTDFADLRLSTWLYRHIKTALSLMFMQSVPSS